MINSRSKPTIDIMPAHSATMSPRRFERRLAAGALLLAVVPVVLFAMASMGLIRAMNEREIERTAQRMVEQGAKHLDAVLQGKVAALAALIALHPVEDLQRPEALAAMLRVLTVAGGKDAIIALDLLDANGNHLARAGTDVGAEANDLDENGWFRQALAGGVAISDVMGGATETPHFVIAMADPLRTSVLRATLSTGLLDAQARDLSLGIGGTSSLVNSAGVPQTRLPWPGEENGALVRRLLAAPPATRINNDIGFAAGAWLAKPRWMLVGVARWQDVPGWAGSYRILAVGVVLALVAGGLPLAIAFARRLVMRLEQRQQDQERRRHQLIHIEQLATIGRVAGGIAGDIRAPLEQISQQASRVDQLVRMEPDDRGPRADEARAALAVIVQQARHIGVIVDRLRRLSRSTADDYEIHLNWLLREILCFFEKEAEAHNIILSRQFDEQLPPIRTDGSQVQQLLLALTENALNAVGADGRIDFITYATPGEVHVQIADNGVNGMTSERMDRLWQPLSIGLGSRRGEWAKLSLYSNIVYRLGGRISAQERPQGGTLCTVSLPARA